MNNKTSEVKPVRVVIIGGGVAGLGAAYGLTRPELEGRFDVRVIEKRTAGYPIHLSPSGRDAISTLLSPADQERLHLARQSLPARHDGISFFNSDCKRIWHTLREPFESSLVERGDILRILRDRVKGIEYDRKVVSVKDLQDEAVVMLSTGEIIRADIVIGSDGMFSAVRKTLHPKDDFRPMPWVTCNFRLSPSFLKAAVSGLGADPRGINVFCGTGWSAALMPTHDGAYVALTVPSPMKDIRSAFASLPDLPLIQAIRADVNTNQGRAFPLYSAKYTQAGRGRLILIGDAAHGMNPFCGAGASMALSDAASLVKVLTGTEDLAEALPRFHNDLKKRADPMIKMSKVLLWLAQGKTPMGRVARGTAFRTIEVVEKVLPTRKRMQKRLDAVLADAEEAKRLDAALAEEANQAGISPVSSTSTLLEDTPPKMLRHD